jgi:Trypsin-co-occurring domain 2
VGLAEAVDLVRSELEKATKSGARSSLAFEPGPIELEFTVVFDETGGVDAGVRVWVVSVGAKGEISHERTQHMKVTLAPVERATGKRPLISDEGNE